jgi:L-lactate dehydrogenase complex protein LldG
MSAREAILERLKRARTSGPSPAEVLAERRRGPRPKVPADRVSYFCERATALASTVARLPDGATVPGEVVRYLGECGLPPRFCCWPELAGLRWQEAGAQAMVRPAVGTDKVGVTGAFAAIAETGTLMLVSGATTPATTSLLPEVHVAVVFAGRIVDTLEDAFALLRQEAVRWPRAVNLVSGPSRTADIEQSVTLGAHGPSRLHIIVVETDGRL